VGRAKGQRDADPHLLVSHTSLLEGFGTSLNSTRRSGDVVEQIMKPQWWVSCKPMAEEALKVSFAVYIVE
jgi:valyl-tRNA synthetase